jgi:hypothetical protein
MIVSVAAINLLHVILIIICMDRRLSGNYLTGLPLNLIYELLNFFYHIILDQDLPAPCAFESGYVFNDEVEVLSTDTIAAFPLV